jgi:hypothetical protein
MSSRCPSSVPFAKLWPSKFVPLAPAADRLGSIDIEEKEVLAEGVLAARDVAGFAADAMLDEERFNGVDGNDCTRCARAKHGNPASKITNGKNRPQKRDIAATAKRI